ncbi:MAG TPA: pyridoxal phosphate-dependent aminotransferase [Woeseiaceae bacterium]|nr:pyridoxal phosphate-dependent aminotransferase [Woeseiaceae bacterium]
MSLPVSARMARVQPSPTGAVLALAARLQREGRDIISLGAGEPDFDTPGFIKDAAVQAIADGATKYTPIDGTASLKDAIRQKFARDNRLDYKAGQILVSSGAKQSLFNLCLALLGPGDEAIIPAPYWVSYPDMVRLAGADPVILETDLESNFKVTPQQLDNAINERTRLVIINSPSNPTGASYSQAEFAALGEVLAAHPEIVIASDEIYEHIYWARDPFTSFAAACPQLLGRTVTINGVSKAYAMTGWRIGYAGGPETLIRAMTTIQSQSTSNACSISQAAAEAALLGDQSCVSEMCAAYKRRHDYFVTALNMIDGVECRPGEGSFYAFPKVMRAIAALELNNDAALVEHLLNEANIACVPGSAFGLPGHVRLSFACSMGQLEEAVKRIKRALVA